MSDMERSAEDLGATTNRSPKFKLEQVSQGPVSIKVVGIGGCGSNIVDYMVKSDIASVTFITVNTDAQALDACNSPFKLRLGERVTQGFGTGSNPELGRDAALENTEEISELLNDADMVYLTLGLGGGTGTGAAPVIASLAKQMGALTLAAAVKPFAFEGKRRTQIAESGLKDLLEQVDTAIVIPNERLFEQMDTGSSFFDGFQMANMIATQTLVGITDLITKPGVMNNDFADLRAIFSDAGLAVMGAGQAAGRDAAIQASREAIGSPMMDHEGLSRASKILVNISGSEKFGMHDAREALQLIHREIASDAELKVGVVRDDTLKEDVRVMVIASSFSHEPLPPPTGRLDIESEAKPRFPRGESTWKGRATVQQRHVEPTPARVEEPQPPAPTERAPASPPVAAREPEQRAEPVEPPTPTPPVRQEPETVRQTSAPRFDRRLPNGHPDPGHRGDEPTLPKSNFFRRRPFFS